MSQRDYDLRCLAARKRYRMQTPTSDPTRPEDLSLTPLELIAGHPLGRWSRAPQLPKPGSRPRPALESVIQKALRQPPLLVLFSGGRDSSALLALATHVARREALEEPIAFTHRYPGAAGADETEWQEAVIRHLSIQTWERVDANGEFDWVGPLAGSVLEAVGLGWPSNAYTMVPALSAAGGGAVLTGLFGDELLRPDWPARRLRLAVAGRFRPTIGDVRRAASLVLPPPLRQAVIRRRLDPSRLPAWLGPSARLAYRSALSDHEADRSIRWSSVIRAWWQQRIPHIVLASLGQVADLHSASLLHPFGAPEVVAAFASNRELGTTTSRTESMNALFGDLLPAPVLERRTKGHFHRAFWGAHSSAFAHEWEGSDVDPEWIDVPRLRATWVQASDPTAAVPAHSASAVPLLQAAWLADNGRPSLLHAKPLTLRS